MNLLLPQKLKVPQKLDFENRGKCVYFKKAILSFIKILKVKDEQF